MKLVPKFEIEAWEIDSRDNNRPEWIEKLFEEGKLLFKTLIGEYGLSLNLPNEMYNFAHEGDYIVIDENGMMKVYSKQYVEMAFNIK